MALSKRLKSASKKVARLEKVYASGKREGKRMAKSGKRTGDPFKSDTRRVVSQYRSTLTGRKRKGNIAGKVTASAGLLRGDIGYRLTSARKAALKKAQQISARKRKGKGK